MGLFSKVKAIGNRVYSDYFMKNRFGEYEDMLRAFLEEGYIFLPICEYGDAKNMEKVVFIRHDIDSEPAVARKFFEIEKKLHIRSTYYFRLSTLDGALMQAIETYGSETGYHYEELATYAKQQHIKDQAIIEEHIPEIQNIVLENVRKIETQTGLKIRSMSSHGDFANRKLGIMNKALLTEKFIDRLGIVCEAYDMENILDFRLADRGYPDFWVPRTPQQVMQEPGMNKGLLLIHPRSWCSAPAKRMKLDVQRMVESIKY